MRWVVMVFALLGALSSLGLGVVWYMDVEASTPKLREMAAQFAMPGGERAWQTIEAEWRQRSRAYPFLLASGALGLVGAFLARERHKYLAALTLAVAGIGPGLLHAMSFLFTSPLLLASLLAFTISGAAANGSGEERPAKGHKSRRDRDQDDRADD